MARENVMSTPIFDQLLREMAQRAEPRATPQEQVAQEPEEQAPTTGRRRHRAE
jgi:hypothetical protein